MGKDLKGKELGKGLGQRGEQAIPLALHRAGRLSAGRYRANAECAVWSKRKPSKPKSQWGPGLTLGAQASRLTIGSPSGLRAIPPSRLPGFSTSTISALHIRPYLGTLPLRDITPFRITRWLGELQRDGRSAAARKHAHRTLSTTLGVKGAEGDGRLPRGNPCRLARCPAPPRPDWRKIGYEEFEHLISCLDEYDRGLVPSCG